MQIFFKPILGMTRVKMLTLKFGGTSMGNASRILNSVEIMRGRAKQDRISVVVSAVAGVSNKLQEAIDACVTGSEAAPFITTLRETHLNICKEIKTSVSAFNEERVMEKINASLLELQNLLSGLKTFGECPSTVHCRIMGMGELIIITMLAGGVLELIRTNGGIRYLMNRILRHVRSPRTAELSIAALVSVTDLCTANNTVAIITVSGIAKDISRRFGLDPRRVASILDTFSCIMQGVIPYGAQLLMGAALASINPIEIIPHLYYPFILCLFALGDILLIPRKYPGRHTIQTSKNKIK